MTNPTPEEARDALVAAALEWFENPSAAANQALEIAAEAHLAACHPPAPLRCEPSAEAPKVRFYWLVHTPSGSHIPADLRGGWRTCGAEVLQTPEQMAAWGWSVYAPAVPPVKMTEDEAYDAVMDIDGGFQESLIALLKANPGGIVIVEDGNG